MIQRAGDTETSLVLLISFVVVSLSFMNSMHVLSQYYITVHFIRDLDSLFQSITATLPLMLKNWEI